MLRRSAAGLWCGPNAICLRAPVFIDRNAFSANSFDPTQQEDQELPALSFYMYGQLSAYWMDMRTSPLVSGSVFRHDDSVYDYRRRVVRWLPTIEVPLSTEESPRGWPQALGVPVRYQAAARPYGDLDFTATASLHSHWLHLFWTNGVAPPTGVTIPGVVTILSSPRDPPQ